MRVKIRDRGFVRNDSVVVEGGHASAMEVRLVRICGHNSGISASGA